MDNTRSRIINLDKRVFFILRETLIYFNMNGYMMASSWVKKNRRDTFKEYLIDEEGFFPTGIVHRVRSHLLNKKISVQVFDNRVIPKTNKMNFAMHCSEPPAYVDQEKCTLALLKANQGIGQVPTGVGKTRIIKDIIQQLGVKTLVITPSTALKEQTAEYLEECFGSKDVGVYDKRTNNKPITIVNYHAIKNTDPREWTDFDLMIMDEFHNSSNSTIREFNITHLNSFYFRFGLTATNFTPDEHSAILLESVLSDTVFQMPILEAIKKNYILPMVPVFYDLQNANLSSRGDYRKDYKVFMDDNESRNQIILDIIKKVENSGHSSLALVKHIDHGKKLSSLGDAVFLNGQDANAKKNQDMVKRFNNKEFNKIVGTSVIGEGINTKACSVVINAKGGKSRKELLQNIGRCLRKKDDHEVGYYFDFIDRKQKNLYKHSQERMRIIREEFGVEPRIVKL